MTNAVNETAQFIARLGGRQAVRALVMDRTGVDLTGEAISNWVHRGVPWRYRLALAQEAERRNVPLPDKFLD